MPILPHDLEFHLSQPTARQGMKDKAVPAESLGGYVAVSRWSQADRKGNLFPDITGEQNENGVVDHRCIFVVNNHEDLPLLDAVAWVESRSEPGAQIEIAVDPTTAMPAKSAEAQALFEPAAQLRWSEAFGRARALRLGVIPAGHVKALWIRRRAQGLPPVDRDFFVLRVRGDTTQ